MCNMYSMELLLSVPRDTSEIQMFHLKILIPEREDFKEKSSPLKVVAWPHFLTGKLLGVDICSHRFKGFWLYEVIS